jgi:hypothetical protein
MVPQMGMLDPFLRAHQLAPRFFSMSGKLYPISVRDQMVRAQMFVTRAIAAGYFNDSDHNRLIVVGAGAAGVTASICAVEQGVPTLLLERHLQPFNVQANCQTRWLCPTLYDFPAKHWPVGEYPPSTLTAAPPLIWKADWVHVLIGPWRDKFRDVKTAANSILEYRPYLDVLTKPELDPSERFTVLSVEINDPVKGPYTEKIPAAIVLLATGFGEERRFLMNGDPPVPHPTWGYAFWEDDPFDKPNFDVKGGARPKVLISGSGDGAIQDFLRIVTTDKCKSPKDIFEKVQLPDKLMLELASAENWAQRAFGWGGGVHPDHGELTHLHQIHLRIVNHLLNSDGGLPVRLNSLLKDPLPEVKMVFECDHFSQCYGMNRFIGLLIGTYLERRSRTRVFFPGRRVKDIESCDRTVHVCQHNAPDCHGKMHRVALVEWPDCRGVAGRPAESFEANILVLRHGLLDNALPYDPTPPSFRQTIPYQLPR